MVDPYKILKRPMLTEKSTSLREMESPKFTFVVDKKSE
jgi:ribosomal protein L23